MGPRQLSVSSDSRLLEDEIKQEVKVILRPKKPPRPQSEVFLDQVDKRRTKRYSAFGVSWEKEAHTVWKFQNFCIIQILREINFEDFWSAKSAILTHLEALKSYFYDFLHY